MEDRRRCLLHYNFLLKIALDLETANTLFVSCSGFESLGDSYCLARRRFKSLEAKLDRNPALKAQYSAFLREYMDFGHVSLVTKEPSETQFFCPTIAYISRRARVRSFVSFLVDLLKQLLVAQ